MVDLADSLIQARQTPSTGHRHLHIMPPGVILARLGKGGCERGGGNVRVREMVRGGLKR